MKKVVSSDNSTSKTFKSEKDGVSVSFTVNIDNTKQLRDLLECLDQTRMDVEDEIVKLEKSL